MIIAVQGSKQFDNYDVFMRAMGVAMSDAKSDTDIIVWTTGPFKVNTFTATFCNLSENYLKSVGKKIAFAKVTEKFVLDNMGRVNYFAYLCQPHEGLSPLTAQADLANIEVGVFRY